jgi:hypothetical protein
MNYLGHYTALMDRAKDRILDSYTETHHIIPKCLDGDDNIINLVELTPEEHFVAHQLLVRIYPNNRKILHAAIMMTVGNDRVKRNNKLYGWLKRLLSKSASLNQSGEKNSQYGTAWVYKNSGECTKIPAELEADFIKNGWSKGRIIKNRDSVCPICNKHFRPANGVLTCSRKCYKKTHPMYEVLRNREEEFLQKYNQHKTIAKARREMKYLGNIDYFYRWAEEIINNTTGL